MVALVCIIPDMDDSLVATPSIGARVRKLAGRWEVPLCKAYRRLFVDLDVMAEAIASKVPHNAHVLDVGGGDGAMIDAVLRRRPDLRATMLDLRPAIGQFLSDQVRDRVELLPGVALTDYHGKMADVVLTSDVLHHIPVNGRQVFLNQANALVRPGGKLIIKDVEPGSPRAWLGWMADRYISGDKDVSLISSSDLIMMASGTPDIALLSPPNYVIAFKI